MCVFSVSPDLAYMEPLFTVLSKRYYFLKIVSVMGRN